MDLYDFMKDGNPGKSQSRQPGIQQKMDPLPIEEFDHWKGSGKLQGKVALITGGDSGIGRAVAIAYAKEGANVAISYLDEHDDAAYAKQRIEEEGGKCVLYPGDISDATFCENLIQQVVKDFNTLDILVNNAARQEVQNDLTAITPEQFERTFRTNFFSFFYLSRAALPHLGKGNSIINTASINPYIGNPTLIDYTSTKGAIVAFTRSLAKGLASKGIRVNGVAPGPIWTPLIPATMQDEMLTNFGTQTPLGRPGQPVDLVGSYVLLASDEAAYMTGQFIHVNGGDYMSS
ncbi:SDR family oxidoreductase [Terribacillus sp. DMT04]|uniref:SDR family oxidoreductase n=1 Tax=Terribacillus sp. DMT04 TaxID=2850441 RepID=UPI001C2B9B9F|nr:SDR family oxidoreductase [Terribacillus sp. DMT04]QXE02079.1 SDR family oxidoreductase [Terribacillus sp. DMT04]